MNFLKRIILIVLLVYTISAAAYDPIAKSQFMGFKGAGDFVESTTYVGSAVGCFIMAYPAAIITETFRLVAPNWVGCDKIGYYIVAGTSKGIGAAFGFFPYIFHSMFFGISSETQQTAAVSLPKELVTPTVPVNIGDVENKAVDKADIIPDEVLELKSPKAVKEEQTQEEKEEEKAVERTEAKQTVVPASAPIEPAVTTQPAQKAEQPVEQKQEKPKPIEVNPELPSWIHKELNSSEKIENQ